MIEKCQIEVREMNKSVHGRDWFQMIDGNGVSSSITTSMTKYLVLQSITLYGSVTKVVSWNLSGQTCEYNRLSLCEQRVGVLNVNRGWD